jgi:hypothetical protein
MSPCGGTDWLRHHPFDPLVNYLVGRVYYRCLVCVRRLLRVGACGRTAIRWYVQRGPWASLRQSCGLLPGSLFPFHSLHGWLAGWPAHSVASRVCVWCIATGLIFERDGCCWFRVASHACSPFLYMGVTRPLQDWLQGALLQVRTAPLSASAIRTGVFDWLQCALPQVRTAPPSCWRPHRRFDARLCFVGASSACLRQRRQPCLTR